MDKKPVSHRTLTKNIWFAISVFILIFVVRVLYIFIPPIVVYVSPTVVKMGQSITLWGFMGSKNVREASTLMLGSVPITDENIPRWGLFTIKAKITESEIERLKKNTHAALYLQYKNYRSARFLIVPFHAKHLEKAQEVPFLPRLTMRNERAIQSKDKIVFSLDASRSNTNPLFTEEYSFIVETDRATHTVYPYDWDTVSDDHIVFSLPVFLFPTPPQGHAKAKIRVIYKGTSVGVHKVALTASSLLNPGPYEFVAEFIYGATFKEDVTNIMPLSRPWQRVHQYNKRSNTKIRIEDSYLHRGLLRGFVKNVDIKKMTFLIMRYPLRSFEWKTLSSEEERAAFVRVTQGIAPPQEETAEQNMLFIPRYLQDSKSYFDVQFSARMRNVALSERASGVTLEELIIQLVHESESMVPADANAILNMPYETLVGVTQGITKSTFTETAQNLAILAQLLREYGIPAQVVIGFRYISKEDMKKLKAETALWLEVFTAEYGVVPLRIIKKFSTVSLELIDHRFVGYAVLEQIAYLHYINQVPRLPSVVKSFILRN